MPATSLKQIYKKLGEIDTKVSALLVKEEKPTFEERRAILRGEKEFKEGKFRAWTEIRQSMK